MFDEMATALVLLQDYEDALTKRDMPLDIKAQYEYGHDGQGVGSAKAFSKRKFDLRYGGSPGEKSLERLKFLFSEGDHAEFFDLFRIALDDMDSQYIEISNARRALFKGDVFNQRACSIVIDETSCLEMVNWEVDEPDYAPPEPPPPEGSLDW
jgi:hypothetical protein